MQISTADLALRKNRNQCRGGKGKDCAAWLNRRKAFGLNREARNGEATFQIEWRKRQAETSCGREKGGTHSGKKMSKTARPVEDHRGENRWCQGKAVRSGAAGITLKDKNHPGQQQHPRGGRKEDGAIQHRRGAGERVFSVTTFPKERKKEREKNKVA